ncbi:MAG: magnesium chelatase subunit ChlI family protein [Alphaproteobacteria bacterium]|jgi:predicted ATPase with chaperone activity
MNASAAIAFAIARGWHRARKVAGTNADLASAEHVGRAHVAEDLGYWRIALER